MSKKWISVLIPVISIILGLIVGAIVMLATGFNPIDGYIALWNGVFGDSYNLGETIRAITPYVFAGLAVAFAFRTGMFNIGVEGQLIMGWLAAAYVGYAWDLPNGIHAAVAIIAAAVAGGLWAFIPGLLKAKLQVHEVIVTIMMNYIALHVANATINYLSDGKEKTETIKESASLTSNFLGELTDFSRLHWGFVIALAAVIVMWFILQKTTRGYELKAVGFNKNAAEYSGMNVKKNIILAMVISGAFAGLGGAMEALGTFGNIMKMTAFSGIGFDGIAVALLGANQPFGVLLGAILFGSLKNGGLNMPNEAGIPDEIVSIVIALIVFFVASGYIIQLVLTKMGKKNKKNNKNVKGEE
ncbi:putative ABC transporter permease protein YufP [Kurthia zopfii]|uniref:D-allose transport system permease protein AlsC n=1 Tax=Kurthia zopfii TaxID=1650 RepID=A0A2U3AE23_9BACL|nr:ABC transporter permease [Kurthia zopfii]PWI22786.1 branched-chain amino acid ABC transporter permease [Kurthia zopfii]TDR41827.1 nucleoside ABC transporter membrane protein [Kurthia zopfii]STX09138.1 D-allose transport system permease protein AlsC [Kurthia zopfii]VEI08848.1 D-allose transport system permease protein AlsC [Kurthia zopfii]GEK31296.1 putative ABC transporter permease protein YufP [Kurthia zopfii]